MPPTHLEGGNVSMFQPYVVGQSGTERPEPVLVTKLPASTSSTVQAARNFANVWSISAGRKTSAPWPCQPAACSVCRRGASRRRLEREVDFLGFLRPQRDALRRGAELFMPRLDRVR